MKDTAQVCSRSEAEVVKIFDGMRPRKLTRPAAVHSYPGLLGITSCVVMDSAR
jgi:thioredoxin reductase